MVRLSGSTKALPPRHGQGLSLPEDGRPKAAGEVGAAPWHPPTTLSDFSLIREKGSEAADMLEERSLSPNEPEAELVRLL